MGSRPTWCSRSLVALAAIGWLAAGCSYNPRRPAAGWTAHDSRSVRVYSSTMIEHEYAQEWLETAFHAYRSSFFQGQNVRPVEAMYLQVEPGSATRFFLPNDDPPRSWALEGMPGGGRIGHDGLIVLTDRGDFRGASKQVAHQLIRQTMPHAPLWLQVGFAQYLSEYRIHYKGNDWLVCYGTQNGFQSPSHYLDDGFGARSRTVRNVAGRDVIIPVGEMLDADWYGYARGRYWFNFTAYAFVSFLIHGNDARHAARFPVLLSAIAQGLSSLDALARAYPHILPDEFDDLLADYVASPRKGIFWQEKPDGMCFRIPPGFHAEKRAARSPVAETDVQAALDDLRRMPLWRKYGSWYPTDVLMAQSGPLKRTPVPAASAPAGEQPRPGAPAAPRVEDKR